MTRIRPVVLGLGNPLFRDEGVGIHIIHQLMEQGLADQAELIDGGTDGLSLLYVVESTDRLLVIDAVDDSAPPGAVRRLSGADVPKFFQRGISSHQSGFPEVLALAELRGSRLPELVLIGIQPESLEWGLELTPAVAAAIPEAMELIYRQLYDWLQNFG